MQIIDVSLPLGPELLTWPGDPPLSIEPASRMAQGDAANVSSLHFGTHTGTHIDPPFHFIDGAPTVEDLPLDAFVGEAYVADLTHLDETIGANELEALKLSEGTERVLFKTRNSELWAKLPVEFPEKYVHLSPDGAKWIVNRGIRLVGTDFLSIERRGAPGHPTHVTLLEAGVVIAEGLDLRSVQAGVYQLVCLPLRIVAGDGAPARAVLIAS